MASPPKTTSDYYALVRNETTQELIIIMFDDVDRADISWLNDKTKWPGSHNPNKFLKVTKWIDADEERRGELLFIGNREEAEREKVRLEPVKVAGGVTIDLSAFVDSFNSLTSRVDKLESENESLRLIVNLLEKDKNLVYEQIKEKANCFKYVTQYKFQVQYNELMISLTAASDLEGFKVLVAHVMGSNFDQEKKDARQSYEKFIERERLYQLMGYYCHCRMMMEENPELSYGSSFPDYPASVSVQFEPSASSTSKQKRKNSGQSIGNKKARVESSPVVVRTSLLRSAYAKSFTNYYQNLAKGEEAKELQKLKSREYRRKKKVEAEAKAKNPQPLAIAEFGVDTQNILI